jgi:hypothetical protein
MRGTIRCQSRLGAGSTFTLELPACQPEVSFVAPEVLRLHNALLDARHANGVTSEMLATGA